MTYIATKLWAALTEAEFTQQYWFGRWVESDWRQGSAVTYWTDASRSHNRRIGATEETRTPDLTITNRLLYRLSYGGKNQPTDFSC